MKTTFYFFLSFNPNQYLTSFLKHLLLLLLAFLVSVPLLAQSPVEVNGALSVSGNRIVNSNNEVVSFSGTSLFWSNDGWGGEKYYNAAVVDWLQSDWDIGIIRAAMGVDETGGYIQYPASNKSKVTTVVDAAIANGVYVIIDWHSHHAENYQSEAISFFQQMAQTYGNTPNVIYEIYNEPLGSASWSGQVKPYAEAVIGAIRAIDPDNLIIVGTPTWSQDVDVASNDPITGYSNIAYTLHFYAGTHTQYLRDKATTALNNGIALMVTEWGTVNASGDGAVAEASTQQWVDFMKANDLTNANWSINDKAEGASALKPGTSTSGIWADSDLTASGLLVRDIVRNWDGGGTGGNNCNPTPVDPALRINNGNLLFTNQASLVVGDNLELSPAPSTGGSWSWTGRVSFNSSSRVVTISNIQTSQAGNYVVTYTNDCGAVSQATFSIGVSNSGGGDGVFCSNPTPISLPYAKDGQGEFCLQTSGNVNYVNSWNLDLLEINGVDYTNQWSNTLPAKANGSYYIHYVASVPWAHFEMDGSSESNSTANAIAGSGTNVIYPNPSEGSFSIRLPEKLRGKEITLKVLEP